MYVLQKNYTQFSETTLDLKNVMFLLIYNHLRGTGGHREEGKYRSILSVTLFPW